MEVHVWVTGGCRGRFHCRGSSISCGRWDTPSTNCTCASIEQDRRELHASRCRNISSALLSGNVPAAEAAAALEPWGVTNDQNGWKYHICGSPVRRRKSATGIAVSSCAHGASESAAAQCRAPQSIRSAIPMPALRPRVRKLLESLADQTIEQLGALPVTEGACFVSDVEQMSPAARRFVAGLGRQRCAVVGNSPSVLGRALGREIDQHDVVLRYNFAPTRGYEADVGTRTTVRLMGRSWVVNESDLNNAAARHGGEGGRAGRRDEGRPLLIHRYNNPHYLAEDLTLNRGYPIATIEHYFARSAFRLGVRSHEAIGRSLKGEGADAPDAVDATELARYRWGHARLSISSGFAGVIYALHRCSAVTLYGFDVNSTQPGHYFSDALEGIVPRLQAQLLREPRRRNSLSVEPGIAGVRLVGASELSRVPARRRARLLDFSSRAAEFRDFVRQQYTNTTPSHPYVLERGILRIFAERGCVALRGG